MSENNFDDVLSSITSNPDLMNKISEIAKSNKSSNPTDILPQIIAAISPSVNAGKTENRQSDEGEKEEPGKSNTEPQVNDTALLGVIGSLGKTISKNSSLLNALKPYLSKNRADLVDNIVKVSQIANIIKMTK